MKYFLFIAGLLFLFPKGQAQTIVKLKPVHVAFVPGSFYIQSVVDDREDKSAVGSIKGGGNSGQINLANGAAPALNAFIAANVSQNKSAQPIVLHISRLHFSIKKSDDLWQEEGEILLTFYANGQNLIEYSGRGTKKTDGEPLDFVDEFVRKAIENDFKKFDSWWAENREKIPLSAAVKVSAVLGATPAKPDLIVYSLQRPLQISDFKGRPEADKVELAATLSGTGLATSGEVVNGQWVLHVTITPYFNKSLSWFKTEGRSAQVLAHEQTHFDITAIKACELLHKIQNAALTQDNYESKLHELMQWNTDATDQEQKTYDEETNHGTIKDKQLEWEKRISEEVKRVGCY